MSILLHSYTFRSYSIERAFQKAKEFGYAGIELSTVHFNFFNLDQEIKRLDGIQKKYELPIITADFPANFITSDESLRESVEYLRKAIPLLKELGVRILNGGVGPLAGKEPSDFSQGGSAIATEEHYERAIKGLKEIVPLLEENNLLLTLEIHMNTLHDTAASAKRIIEEVNSPLVLANLDLGNMYATPQAEEPIKAIEILGDRIGYIHLKNCRKIGDRYDYTWALEDGDIDYFRALSFIYKKGYKGDICIEYCGLGDPTPRARKDILYLKDILNELKGG
jgi:sugar phosphate isomerase/epimerase